MKKRCLLLALLSACGIARATTSGDVVVSPESKGVFIDKFFKDYKSSNNPNPSNAELDTLFIEEGFNGIRTPIYGTVTLPAHPSAGTVVGSYYDGHVGTILKAKQRNPNLIIFASKKLDGQDSFPSWTKDANGVIPAQYAIMLADYIEYMISQGIAIDVLGIDNERQFNEGQIWASKHKNIVDELRALSVSRGFPMPLIIGHEDYGPDKDNWMANLMNNGWGDRLDIFGTHYYPNLRPLSGLQSDLAWAGSREKWHSELHWDNPADGDLFSAAEKAIGSLWDCTDNGMNAFMWWSYSRTGFKGSLMQQVSVPLIGAYALAVDDVDGASISTLGKLQTRAFLKGNQLTVYAVNNTAASYPSQVFRVDSGHILGNVSALQWTSTNQTSGTASGVVPLNTQSFQFTLPARSISSFTFTYVPPGLVAHYPFEGNADDVSTNHLHGTVFGGTAFVPGRDGYAASFGSTSDGVAVPTVWFDDLLSTFWLKTGAASGPLIVGNDLALELANSNVVFSIGTNSIASFKPVNDGRWHHVAAERRIAGGAMRLYVDGRLEAYGTGADATLEETGLVVGGVAGMMDEVRFFDRALQSNDVANLHGPSVLLGVGGNAAEKGPVASFVALSQTPAGADYPYIDLVEDDGTWLGGYRGTTYQPIQVSDASDPFLAPHAGATFFKTTTGTWWRGRCKPQLDNLLVEAGTYSVSFHVGDGDTSVLFYSAGDTNLPVSGNNVGLTATDPLAPVLPDMNSAVNSLLNKLDPTVATGFHVGTVPGDGEWVQWTIDYTVPANSPMIGRQLGFFFRKPASSDPQTTAAFDGPLIIGFVPATAKPEPLIAVQYNLGGSSATPGDDYTALPSGLSGTNSIVPVADLVAEGTEQIVFNLEPSTNYFISGSGSASVAIVDHPMDAWRATMFGTNATNPAIAGDTANPDGDARNNELEWALVTDPLVADVPAMNPVINEPNFIVSYNRRVNSGYAIGTSWSYSLTSPIWRTDGGMQEITVGQNGDVQTVAALIPIDGTKKFVRIGVGQ